MQTAIDGTQVVQRQLIVYDNPGLTVDRLWITRGPMTIKEVTPGWDGERHG